MSNFSHKWTGSTTLIQDKIFVSFLLRTSYVPEDIIWGAKFTYDTLEEFETHLMAHYRNRTVRAFDPSPHQEKFGCHVCLYVKADKEGFLKQLLCLIHFL